METMSPDRPSRPDPAKRRAGHPPARVTRETEKQSKVERVRAQAARRRRRPVLGVDAIIDKALRIVDAEGVDAVSMRRVAAEFDTGPASLYAHVANKDELLRLVLDRIIEELEVPSSGDWQDVVRAWAHNSRTVMMRHKDIARLSFAHIPSGPKMMESIETLLRVMIEGGVPPQVAAWALDITSLYVAADAYEGWLLGQRFDDGSGRDPEDLGMEYLEGVRSHFTSLPAERYPYLTGNVQAMMTGGSDERFGFGIDMLIAGFAAQVTRGGKGSDTP
jgi:AcrR family transcriptional regulator